MRRHGEVVPFLFALVMAPALFLALTLTSSPAAAQTVTGFIKNSNSSEDLSLIVKEHKKPLKIMSTAGLLTRLRGLRDGNLIVARGWVYSERNTVWIEAIQTIGLQELIGTWQSATWEVFEFRDFSRLNLYMPTADESGAIMLTQSHALAYAVTPEQADRYSIFISDRKRMMIGTLELGEKRLELTVYDSESGRPSENISLSPLPMK